MSTAYQPLMNWILQERTIRVLVGQLSPLKTHHLAQSPGSFNDALQSSVKRTVFMSVVMHFCDHSMRTRLCLGFRAVFLIVRLIDAI